MVAHSPTAAKSHFGDLSLAPFLAWRHDWRLVLRWEKLVEQFLKDDSLDSNKVTSANS